MPTEDHLANRLLQLTGTSMQPQARSTASNESNATLDEAHEWVGNHVIPWLAANHDDFTMNGDGSYHSGRTIPTQLQQWLNLALFMTLSQAPLSTIVDYLRNTSIGPTHEDHPMFSPPMNALIRKEGIQIFGKNIYAPHGVHKVIKRGMEHTLAMGKLYHASPLSTSSDDSDSAPPKRARKTITRKKPPRNSQHPTPRRHQQSPSKLPPMQQS